MIKISEFIQLGVQIDHLFFLLIILDLNGRFQHLNQVFKKI